HTRSKRDWSSDVCSSDLREARRILAPPLCKIFGQRAGKGSFSADAGAGSPETGSRIKGQTGKQDGCGTVGIGGNALRESGQGRQIGRASGRERVGGAGGG